jgi:hypothetical protein
MFEKTTQSQKNLANLSNKISFGNGLTGLSLLIYYFFWQFFRKCAKFIPRKKLLIVTKTGLATLGTIFPQTHQVTLVGIFR